MEGGRWDCVCGANAVAGAFCPFCGRRSPSGELPPLPASVGAWLPPVAPGRVGLTPWSATLAAVVALLLFVGGSVVAVRTQEEPATPLPRTMDDAVRAGMRFVEVFRGKPFLADVDVTLLDDDAFVRALNGEEDDDPGEDEADFEATMQGLRLADPSEDVDAVDEELLGETVVGFYDDETDRLVVRGGRLNAYVQLTIVHELAHAWQDQHFDLTALWDATETDDESWALRALIEGDATRVERAWREGQPKAVRDEIDQIERDFGGGGDDGGGELSRAAASLDLYYAFPYAVGTTFVDVLAEGGNERVDAAFERPPATTAQVFEPVKYREHDAPADPQDPRAEGSVVDRGTLGQVGLLVFLAGGEDIDTQDITASYGWDGDEYVTWRAGARTCTTVSVVMDDEAEREELVRALEPRRLPRLLRAGDDGVLFVSCTGG